MSEIEDTEIEDDGSNWDAEMNTPEFPSTPARKLEIRRKIEDAIEAKRLRDEFGDIY